MTDPMTREQVEALAKLLDRLQRSELLGSIQVEMHRAPKHVQDAASALRAMSTPDEVAAMVAAAYEAAAEYMYQQWDDDDAQLHRDVIRSRTPSDARAALDRAVAEAVEVKVAELREALRPFAKCSEFYPNAKGNYELGFGPIHDPRCPLTFGDYHRARAAIKGETDGTE